MANDLVKIVKDTESSLAAQPSKYSTQLELFVSEDEKILAEFLRQERDEKPYYPKYKDWEIFVGEPEKYSRPKKYMEEQRKKLPESEKQMRNGLTDNLLEMGVNSETVAIFGDFPTMAYKMLDMKKRLYESVVAYAKQISNEKGIKPIDVVRSSEGRDKIHQRTFQTKDQFEWYNNTFTQMGITALDAIYNVIGSLEPMIKEVEKIPVVSQLVKRKINKALKTLKQIPPKAVAESFLRDEMAYDAMRAERIYDNNSETAQVIDAEIAR